MEERPRLEEEKPAKSQEQENQKLWIAETKERLWLERDQDAGSAWEEQRAAERKMPEEPRRSGVQQQRRGKKFLNWERKKNKRGKVKKGGRKH